MIFVLNKNIHSMVDDAIIKSAIGQPVFKVSKVKHGYFVYNKDSEQVAQIVFEPYTAYVTVAESGTIVVCRSRYGADYDIAARQLASDEKKYAEYSAAADGEYAMAGSYENYNFDIYYNSRCVMNVIPDRENPDQIKVRINEGGNLVVLVMIVLSIARLNSDPKSKY